MKNRLSGYYSDSESESGTSSGTTSSLNYGYLAFCSLFVWFCTYFFLIANNIGSALFCNIVFSIIFCTLLLVHAYNCGILKKNNNIKNKSKKGFFSCMD
jgi:hypothetical protein